MQWLHRILQYRDLAERSAALNYFACYNLPYYKLLMLGQLALFAVLGSLPALQNLGPIIAAVAVALAADSVYNHRVYEVYAFPAGAAITALIVALIVTPGSYVEAVGITAVALLFKHGTKGLELAVAYGAAVAGRSYQPSFRNVFNPAALGLFAGAVFLGTPLIWWGAGSVAVFLAGLGIAILIKREDLALSFLGTYWVLTAALMPSLLFPGGTLNLTAFLTGPPVFFAFIMVVEPVTSPNTRRSKILFGVGVAAIAVLLQAFSGALPSALSWMLVDSLLAALLTMNLLHRALGRWMR